MDSRLGSSQCTLPAQQNSKSVRPTDGVPSADLAIRPGPTSPNNRFAGSGPMRGLHCNLRPGGLRFGNARALPGPRGARLRRREEQRLEAPPPPLAACAAASGRAGEKR